jgi:hypothetical protein
MTAVAIRLGPGAARALAAGGPGVVEIALDPGGYVLLGRERWLLLAPERAPLGPLSVLVRGLGPLRAGASVAHTGAALAVGDLRIDLRGARAVGRRAPAPLRGGWQAALDAALAECPPPPALLAAGLAALRGGAIAGLAGLGPGLTPAGDDVLAGYAAWRHADGAPVSIGSDRCSPLGLAYLRCAERGELPDVATRALHAIRAGDARLATRRARALSGWGATSGSAILWGMAAAAGTRA